MKTLFKINFIFLSSLILTASDSLAQSETWQKKTDMPTGLRWLSACSRDGNICHGGFENNDTPPLTTIEVYDVAADKWSSADPEKQNVLKT
jgi:hypothetical protein